MNPKIATRTKHATKSTFVEVSKEKPHPPKNFIVGDWRQKLEEYLFSARSSCW